MDCFQFRTQFKEMDHFQFRTQFKEMDRFQFRTQPIGSEELSKWRIPSCPFSSPCLGDNRSSWKGCGVLRSIHLVQDQLPGVRAGLQLFLLSPPAWNGPRGLWVVYGWQSWLRSVVPATVAMSHCSDLLGTLVHLCGTWSLPWDLSG